MEAREKEQKQLEAQKKIFEGLKFFVNREVPRESLAFVIRWESGRFYLKYFSNNSEFKMILIFLVPGVWVVRCPGTNLFASGAHMMSQMRPSHIRLLTDLMWTNSI